VPLDINPDPSVKSAPAGIESPKVDKPPIPQAERTVPDSLKPSSPKGAQGSPGAGGASTSPNMLPWVRTLQAPPQCRNQPSPSEQLPGGPGLMDSVLPVGLSMMRAHPHHSLRRFRDSVHGSQSPYGTT
jgi:hypothetical protein